MDYISTSWVNLLWQYASLPIWFSYLLEPDGYECCIYCWHTGYHIPCSWCWIRTLYIDFYPLKLWVLVFTKRIQLFLLKFLYLLLRKCCILGSTYSQVSKQTPLVQSVSGVLHLLMFSNKVESRYSHIFSWVRKVTLLPRGEFI